MRRHRRGYACRVVPIPPSTVDMLPAIPHLRLRLTLRADEPARLPPHRGSLLRGAFGAALRRAVCTMGPRQPCATCALRGPCVYTRLFETLPDAAAPSPFPGPPSAPRPYVLEPDDVDGDGGELAAGDELGFGLVLFGQAVELQSYAVVAVGRMAVAGLGAHRRRFTLARVDVAGAEGSLHPGWTGGEPAWTDVPAVLPELAPLPAPDRVTLRFLTPTRLKVDHHLTDRFTFPQLATRTLHRILELAALHVPGTTPVADPAALLAGAEDVRVVDPELRWVEWERWSNRQKTKMRLGGFVGTVTLEGDLTPFTDLLRLAELVHIGKATTFGLGGVRIEASAAP